MRYSVEFKKSAVQKYLGRGSRSVNEILQEIGIASPTIYQWRDQFANVSGMTKLTKPQARSANEKLKSLMEFDALPSENRGEYLRKNGLHEEHIVEWRKQIEDALSPKKVSKQERTEKVADQKKIKDLEKEIRRKDKALAEVSALLVLKKKADLIWGTTEEDE
jgi:transposase-like protein